ncbi:MAG TPA: gamma-glutamyl-gamma-aminobutyrate hydrolase family protein [Candidatus Dormibacteraeota bacterium]|nr:gamma-glutamyl-gamma-aminobutyrate hydrolase family protein [Candidatus Dormibacteraeota bacterium]
MRIGLSFDQGTPKYRLYLGALLAAAEQAGLEIVPLWMASAEKPLEPYFLETLDGIIFTGGADVEPQRYGFGDPEGLCKTFPGRDEQELVMLESAFQRRLPILAICRGMQLLNVYRGGMLVPHLKTAADHLLRDDERHMVQVEATSALGRLARTSEAAVTSSHHQAVNKVGTGLKAIAWHQDRTIEALTWSAPLRKPWMMAVQWHPERMSLSEPLAGSLYEGFLQAVKGRSS